MYLLSAHNLSRKWCERCFELIMNGSVSEDVEPLVSEDHKVIPPPKPSVADFCTRDVGLPGDQYC